MRKGETQPVLKMKMYQFEQLLKLVVPLYAGLYRDFTSIKNKYSHLKTLLSVGGWEFGHGVFSQMVSSAESR